MIIVEGPDGSGKSTLIQQLAHQRRPLKSVGAGVGTSTEHPKGWAGNDPVLVAYVKQIIKAQEEGQAIAFDRFHLSEAAYGPILRSKQLVDEGILHTLSDYLRGQRIPVILCLPPFATTLANVAVEGRERPTYQTEGFLHQAYKAFEALAPWATLVYDYTTDALPTLRG